MDEKIELKKLKKIFSRIEEEWDTSNMEEIFQHRAIVKALKQKRLYEKLLLLKELFLERMGRIPYCNVNEFRTDLIIRQEIKRLEMNLLPLVYSEYNYFDEKKIVNLELKRDRILPQFSIEKLKKRYIALLVNSLNRGGVEQVVYLLATELTKRNINIKVLCLEGGGEIAHQLEMHGIEVVIFGGNGNEFKKYIKKDPPILINSHYVKKYIKFLYNQKIPIVEVVHNMYVFYCKHMIKVEQKNEKYFSKLIAVSEIVKETYQSRIKNSEKVVVVENAALIREEPQKNRIEVRKLLDIPEQAFVILNIGSIDRRKNQIGIVTAFDVVTRIIDIPVYLVFAGNVQDEDYNNKLMHTIRCCTKKNQIKILPYYERVRELYQMADVFILDSYYEGWSIAATEAVYEGLPIIHSRCGSATELIVNGEYGLQISNPAGSELSSLKNIDIVKKIDRFESENGQELVEAIIEIIKHRAHWKKKRISMANNAKNRFSLKNMIDQYCIVFEEVMSLDEFNS